MAKTQEFLPVIIALKAYNDSRIGGSDELETDLIDLICDVAHYADYMEINGAAVFRMALHNYEEEKKEGPVKLLIRGEAGSRRVFVNCKELDPAESQKVFNHSPDGFAWGYSGSGPAQLALGILLTFMGKQMALKCYQEFKRKHVAKWAMEEDFMVELDVLKLMKELS